MTSSNRSSRGRAHLNAVIHPVQCVQPLIIIVPNMPLCIGANVPLFFPALRRCVSAGAVPPFRPLQNGMVQKGIQRQAVFSPPHTVRPDAACLPKTWPAQYRPHTAHDANAYDQAVVIVHNYSFIVQLDDSRRGMCRRSAASDTGGPGGGAHGRAKIPPFRFSSRFSGTGRSLCMRRAARMPRHCLNERTTCVAAGHVRIRH